MDKKIKEYVNNLFTDYIDTKQLIDFKEEIRSNLHERINDLINENHSEKEAFDMAIKELGDITEVADTMSRQAKYDTINELYINKNYFKKKQLIGYPVGVGIILFSVVLAVLFYVAEMDMFRIITLTMPLLCLAIGMFIYLGLTQESESTYPMKNSRAIAYSVTSTILIFGTLLSICIYLKDISFDNGIKDFNSFIKAFAPYQKDNLTAAILVLIPFVILPICVLTYLALSEKSRMKIEAIPSYMKANKEIMEKRGLISGALWIFTVALFFLLGFLIGFKISWTVFLFAIGGEILIEYFYTSKSKE